MEAKPLIFSELSFKEGKKYNLVELDALKLTCSSHPLYPTNQLRLSD